MISPFRARAAILAVTLSLATACASPIGVDRVGGDAVHAEVNDNALSGGPPSAESILALRRAGLQDAWERDPEAALLALHDRALRRDRTDRLFALAELSYHLARRSGDRRRHLAAATYAYMLLFGESVGTPLTRFDARQRVTCEIYNRALVGAFASEDGEEFVLEGGRLELPIGALDVAVERGAFPWSAKRFPKLLPAREFSVEGFRARSRKAGLGAPLIAVASSENEEWEFRDYLPLSLNVAATAFLRPHGSLDDLSGDALPATLELYYPLYVEGVLVDGAGVPLETDVTAPLAMTLEDSGLWNFELLEFLSANNTSFENGIFMLEPYQRFKKPVVFVHGTASSPARWAEMFNELISDPELRTEYQFWFFIYSTGNPITYSAATLRDSLRTAIATLDPAGDDPGLQHMTVIGHSQGGLLARLLATDSGSAFWDLYADTPIDEVRVPERKREQLRSAFFFEPQPFVDRVVFIATPHRGSFVAGGWIGSLASSLISLPALPLTLFGEVRDAFRFDPLEDMPTAVDNMKPDDPFVRTLSALPIAPGVGIHSIIAIDGDEQPPDGDDGVVEYTSAHLDEADSEAVVRSFHSVQAHPLAVDEVRKILRHALKDRPRTGTEEQ